MELNELYNYAEENSINIYCFDLPVTKSLSVMDKNGNCSIGIDPFALDSEASEKERLAHELGHCMTGSFYNHYSEFDIKERAEHRANKWAIKKLIPEDELKKAYKNGIVEIWELAELFGISEQLMQKAVELYRS